MDQLHSINSALEKLKDAYHCVNAILSDQEDLKEHIRDCLDETIWILKVLRSFA